MYVRIFYFMGLGMLNKASHDIGFGFAVAHLSFLVSVHVIA